MKYMTDEEWEELDANFRNDSIGLVLEFYDDIQTFITRLCLSEKLPQSCISTALVFFHKYFILRKGFESDWEKYLTCTACILLSAKVCNQLTPMEEVTRFFLKDYSRQQHSSLAVSASLIFDTSEKLCMVEFEILNSIGFDLNVELPYKYVHTMRFYYFQYLKNEKLIIITTNFINDSFKLPLCLYYDPLLIALASLYLASLYFKIRLVDAKDGAKWYNLIDKNMQLNKIIALSEKINKIYKFGQEPKGKKELKKGRDNIKFEPLSILNGQKINGSNLDVKGRSPESEDFPTFP